MNSYMIILCTLLIPICDATPPNCLELHQSQLNSLNERMNQMLGALYSSPILSKLQSVTKTQPNTSSTTPAETPEPVYDTPHYPSTSSPAPQVVYVAKQPAPQVVAVAPAAPVLSSTRTPRSYYSYEVPDYSYATSPWAHYYDHYTTTLNYPQPVLQPALTPVYDPYRETEFLPNPYQPTYSPPPTYHTPPPAYSTLPPTYHTPPPTYPTPPPAYHVPAPTYHTPPPTYHTPPPTYHTPPPTYHTPPPVYAPSPIPYAPVRYSAVAEYPPYYA